MNQPSVAPVAILACQIDIPDDMRTAADRDRRLARGADLIDRALAERRADVVMLPELSSVSYFRHVFFSACLRPSRHLRRARVRPLVRSAAEEAAPVLRNLAINFRDPADVSQSDRRVRHRCGFSLFGFGVALLSECFDLSITKSVRRSILLKPDRSDALLVSIGLKHSIGRLDPRLTRYIEFVEQTMAAPQTLRRTCAAISVSRRTLARLTRSAFECSPAQLSTRIRPAYAADLLRVSTIRLQDIAEACGYRSDAHFSEAFYKCYSVRPGRYRKASSPTARQRT